MTLKTLILICTILVTSAICRKQIIMRKVNVTYVRTYVLYSNLHYQVLTTFLIFQTGFIDIFDSLLWYYTENYKYCKQHRKI